MKYLKTHLISLATVVLVHLLLRLYCNYWSFPMYASIKAEVICVVFLFVFIDGMLIIQRTTKAR